jgi:hypothetical protein
MCHLQFKICFIQASVRALWNKTTKGLLWIVKDVKEEQPGIGSSDPEFHPGGTVCLFQI